MLTRIVLTVAGRVVPASQRQAWRHRWIAAFEGLNTLIERGEISGDTESLVSEQRVAALTDAFRTRFDTGHWHRFIRSPRFVFLTAGCVAFLSAILSFGYSHTRRLIGFALEAPALNFRGRGFDTFLTYAIPVVFALITGLAIAYLRRPVLRNAGWRYWTFLAAKAGLVIVLLPVTWLEITPLVRMMVPGSEGPRLLVMLLWRIGFVVAFACALGWSVADQRGRCPVCLKRLALPVSVGSLASVFDPATTEMLCEEGHGSLSIIEGEAGDDARWVKLDESWSELFQVRK